MGKYCIDIFCLLHLTYSLAEILRLVTVKQLLFCWLVNIAVLPVLHYLLGRICTTYVDAAYCYQLSSVVCLSVCHTSEPCKNG